MSEPESEIESTGNLLGGLLTWVLIAIVLLVATTMGVNWGAWALAGWCTLLAIDYLQAHMRDKEMYVRLLSELWQLPI